MSKLSKRAKHRRRLRRQTELMKHRRNVWRKKHPKPEKKAASRLAKAWWKAAA